MFGSGRTTGSGGSRSSGGLFGGAPKAPPPKRPPSQVPSRGPSLGWWFWRPRPAVVIAPVPVPTGTNRQATAQSDPAAPDKKQLAAPAPTPVEYGAQERHRRQGCVLWLLIALAVVAVLFMVRGAGPGGSAVGITPSTVSRKPLPKGSVNETRYFTDELGWIGNQTELHKGLKHFYEKTGVQPHVFITGAIDGSHYPSTNELDEFARGLYDDLFTDEAHLLLVFFEYEGVYMDRYVAGVQAKTVIDSEAADILLDYIDRYYYDDDLTDEQFFSAAFRDAADRIMKVTVSSTKIAFGAFVVIVLVAIAFQWWSKNEERKSQKARETEAILKAPLQTYGDIETEQLAQKYDEMPPVPPGPDAPQEKKDEIDPPEEEPTPPDDGEGQGTIKDPPPPDDIVPKT